MAKSCVVILRGGPLDGEWHRADIAHTRLSCAAPPPMYIRPYDPKEAFKPLEVIDYDILGGYAPYPDDPTQVYRLGILRGLDPATELLKILMKGNQHG